MTAELVIHDFTAGELARLATTQPQAVIFEAPAGSGKRSLALWLTGQIVGSEDPLKALQQVLYIHRGEARTVSVEQIRNIEQFLSHKLPGNGKRVVIIDDAHTMTQEAQNALLKTLEEPPAGTTLLLLTTAANNLLSTVRSRAITLHIKRPSTDELNEFFKARGYDASQISRAILMSGGLPGLITALLEQDTEHPLTTAAEQARRIIQANRFERLALVDALSKQPQQALEVCDILQHMAHIKLASGTFSPSWKKLLQYSYEAAEQLRGSAQPKLVLTKLMLQL